MKFHVLLGGVMLAALVSCGGSNSQVDLSISTKAFSADDKTITLDVDPEGYIKIFNGKDLDGWRGYGADTIPAKWGVEDGCLKYTGAVINGDRRAGAGDLMFPHKFKSYELVVEWKISEGGNSGILYMVQEAKGPNRNGEMALLPAYMSGPEYQVLDNVNHQDAKLGKDGNRQSASLYDIIPARPQNSKGFGVWNECRIRVKDGTITHFQNGVAVVEYHPWTEEWTNLLKESKFGAMPQGFPLMNNLGGDNHEGYIVFQDHQNDVWFRNIRVKVFE